MLFGGACTKIYVFPIHLPMYCTSRLIKGLDDRRTNPKFGGAATKFLVSSQIAQKRHLRPVLGIRVHFCFPLGIRVLCPTSFLDIFGVKGFEGDELIWAFPSVA